jgi:hypothetical protein
MTEGNLPRVYDAVNSQGRPDRRQSVHGHRPVHRVFFLLHVSVFSNRVLLTWCRLEHPNETIGIQGQDEGNRQGDSDKYNDCRSILSNPPVG